MDKKRALFIKALVAQAETIIATLGGPEPDRFDLTDAQAKTARLAELLAAYKENW